MLFCVPGMMKSTLLKLKKHLELKENPVLASAKTVREITGADPGSCGLMEFKKRCFHLS